MLLDPKFALQDRVRDYSKAIAVAVHKCSFAPCLKPIVGETPAI